MLASQAERGRIEHCRPRCAAGGCISTPRRLKERHGLFTEKMAERSCGLVRRLRMRSGLEILARSAREALGRIEERREGVVRGLCRERLPLTPRIIAHALLRMRCTIG